jgi:hypothetical protein
MEAENKAPQKLEAARAKAEAERRAAEAEARQVAQVALPPVPEIRQEEKLNSWDAWHPADDPWAGWRRE